MMKRVIQMLGFALALGLSTLVRADYFRGEVGWMTRYGGLGLTIDVAGVGGHVEQDLRVNVIHLVDSDANGPYSRFAVALPAVRLAIADGDYRIEALGHPTVAGSLKDVSTIARSGVDGAISIRKELASQSYWISYAGLDYRFSTDGRWTGLSGADGAILDVTESPEGFVLSNAAKARVLEVKLSIDRRVLAIITEQTLAKFSYDAQPRLTEIEIDGSGAKNRYGFDYDESGLMSGFRMNDRVIDRFTWKHPAKALPRWKRDRVAPAILASDLEGNYTVEVKNEGNHVSHRQESSLESKLFHRKEL